MVLQPATSICSIDEIAFTSHEQRTKFKSEKALLAACSHDLPSSGAERRRAERISRRSAYMIMWLPLAASNTKQKWRMSISALLPGLDKKFMAYALHFSNKSFFCKVFKISEVVSTTFQVKQILFIYLLNDNTTILLKGSLTGANFVEFHSVFFRILNFCFEFLNSVLLFSNS